MSKTKILLCACAKLENKYIEEWIKHYQKLGFDKIVLFDNNSLEDEKLMDVPYVKQLVDEGYIDMFFQPGIRGMQTSQYTECYNIYSNDYDWIAFFDIDEFMEMRDYSDVHDYLEQEKFEGYDAVQILWRIYDDNNQIEVKDGDYSLVNRFKHEFEQPVKPIEELQKQHKYWLKKSIIRGKIHKPIVYFGPNSHTPNISQTFKEFKACNSDGENTDPWYYTPTSIENLEAWLNHYITKTLQEFVENKMVRKCGASNDVGEYMRINILFFFYYNKLTFEKLEWLRMYHREIYDDLLKKINETTWRTAK